MSEEKLREENRKLRGQVKMLKKTLVLIQQQEYIVWMALSKIRVSLEINADTSQLNALLHIAVEADQLSYEKLQERFAFETEYRSRRYKEVKATRENQITK